MAGKSLNEAGSTLVSVCQRTPMIWHDLIGTWQHDPDTEQALADQDVVDLELWR